MHCNFNLPTSAMVQSPNRSAQAKATAARYNSTAFSANTERPSSGAADLCCIVNQDASQLGVYDGLGSALVDNHLGVVGHGTLVSGPLFNHYHYYYQRVVEKTTIFRTIY
jgi:hypothetical protein